MFGWLAKMLLKTPVQGSGCACCEGKRQRLEKMRQEIENGEDEPPETASGLSFSSGTYSEYCRLDGGCSQEYHAKILGVWGNGDSFQERTVHCSEQGEDAECGGCSCGRRG